MHTPFCPSLPAHSLPDFQASGFLSSGLLPTRKYRATVHNASTVLQTQWHSRDANIRAPPAAVSLALEPATPAFGYTHGGFRPLMEQTSRSCPPRVFRCWAPLLSSGAWFASSLRTAWLTAPRDLKQARVSSRAGGIKLSCLQLGMKKKKAKILC